MRKLLFTTLIAALLASVAVAMPDPPGPATVHVVRAPVILTDQKISAPKVLYPEGRVDFDVVEAMVDRMITAVTGKEGWMAWQSIFAANDRVGIMVDAGAYPAQMATVETLINRLVGAGLTPSNILVFSGSENDLFAVGYRVRHEGQGVRVYGADSEGYRGGVSRIPSDYCDAIINLAALQVDPDAGFAGCVANALNCVPFAQRVAARRDLAVLPKAAAHPVVRQKTRLYLLEAYVPLLDVQGANKVTYQYKGLIAGTDPVAVDLIGRKVLQECRTEQKGSEWPLPPTADYLQIAQQKYRLGQAEADKVMVTESDISR
ncbi:MAG: DUF362 domain-containing protein [Armatimonadia bacterium]